MIRSVFLALLLWSGELPAAAPSPSAAGLTVQALQGQTVRGAKGVVLGVVDRVVAGAGGRPVQVLVRPRGLNPGGPRSLSVGGIGLGPAGITTPLTKAEFEAMPPVDLVDH